MTFKILSQTIMSQNDKEFKNISEVTKNSLCSSHRLTANISFDTIHNTLIDWLNSALQNTNSYTAFRHTQQTDLV